MNEYDLKADKTDGKNTYIALDKVLSDTKNFRHDVEVSKEKNKKVKSYSEKSEQIVESKEEAASEQMAQLDDRIESNSFQ